MLRPFLGLALFASLACGGIPGLPSTSSEPPPPPPPPPPTSTATTSTVDRGYVDNFIIDCAYVVTVASAAGTPVPACDNYQVDAIPAIDAGGCAAKRAKCGAACPAECRAAEATCTSTCTDCKAKCGAGAEAAGCVRACAEDRAACEGGSRIQLAACELEGCGSEYQGCLAAVSARAERECDTDCALLRDCVSGARPSGSEACNAVNKRASEFCKAACRP